jgi:hypothetical protein
MTDDEIEVMGLRLLRLFQPVMIDTPVHTQARVEVSDAECQFIEYIHTCLFCENKQPTVRGVVLALGRQSSRTGFRMLQNLIRRGLVWEDEKGDICMSAMDN